MKSLAMLTAALVATAAWAQSGPPPAQHPASGADRGWRDGDGERMRADHEARRAEWEKRRAALEAERESDMALLLELKPAQRGQLHAFLASMRPMHDGVAGADGAERGMRPDMHGGDETFGARLAARQAAFDAHSREEQERLSAARAFYASLDAQQRGKFEAIQRLGHPHPHRGPEEPMHMAHAGPPPGEMPPPPRPGE